MKMSGSEFIDAPRQRVWDALNDPEVLKKSITGCKSLEKSSDKEFSATVQAKVGPVKATFNGDVKLSKLKPPQSYVLSGQGKGGVAGFAKGKAAVKLDEEGQGTRLSYDVDAQVGGKLAQIGSRLIDSTAKKMAADFFKKFAKLAAEDAGAVDASDKPAAKKKPAKKAAKKPAKKPAKKTANKSAAKKPVKKSAEAKAKAGANEAAVSAQSAKTAAPQVATKSAKVAKPEAAPQPQPGPTIPIVLGLVGVGILALFYFLFA